jgi:hypothetical protein
MTIIWKINSEKIAKRHGRNTFDKLSNAEAKKIGYCYCVPYTNKEAIKEYRKGYEEEQRQRQEELMKGGSK